jgi:hypothetical protein
MTFAILLFYMSLGAWPNLGYASLGDAIRSEQPYGDLPREAVQYILDDCGLLWPTESTALCPRYPRPIAATVSRDRQFCAITRPFSVAGCSGAGAVALVDAASGLRWTRDGAFCAPSAVSSRGAVALFLDEPNRALPNYPGLCLLVVSADGDTILSRRWRNRPYTGLASGFGDRCSFSADGTRLVLTINEQPSTSYVRTLYVFELPEGVEHSQNLPGTAPQCLDVLPNGADIRLSAGQGVWRITWTPYGVERIHE